MMEVKHVLFILIKGCRFSYFLTRAGLKSSSLCSSAFTFMEQPDFAQLQTTHNGFLILWEVISNDRKIKAPEDHRITFPFK